LRQKIHFWVALFLEYSGLLYLELVIANKRSLCFQSPGPLLAHTMHLVQPALK